jgi:hypothetical protein
VELRHFAVDMELVLGPAAALPRRSFQLHNLIEEMHLASAEALQDFPALEGLENRQARPDHLPVSTAL